MQQDRGHSVDDAQQIFPTFRLAVQFADGQHLIFDGLAGRQTRQSMGATQVQHGDITWFGGIAG